MSFFERERGRENTHVQVSVVGGGQREKERERIPSRLHIVTAEPDAGLDPQTVR